MNESRIIRAPLPRAVAGDWVTAADISGGNGVATGTTIVESAAMVVTIPASPEGILFWLEVEFAQRRVSGGLWCGAWVKVPNWAPLVAGADDTDAADFYTARLINSTTDAVTRRVRINPDVMQSRSAASALRIDAAVRAKGGQGDTVWAVTGIRSRLVYIPL